MLARRARQVASGLTGLRVRQYDRIGYLRKNSDLYFELLFGAAMAGAVLVPLNWRLAPPEIGTILADAGIILLFVGPGFAAVPAALGLGNALRCVSMAGACTEWLDFSAWRDAQAADAAVVCVGTEDTALQIYTSGTTGVAKRVELSHRAVLAMLWSADDGGWAALGSEDVVLMCMPVSHVAGTMMGLSGLAHGSAVVVMAEFDPAALVETIPRHGVTALVPVPAAILLLLQHPASADADFRSVRRLMYGASPIAEVLVEQARIAFPNAGLWHLYGLTEASGGGTILPPEAHDPALGKLRSCGKPYPGFDLRIVDADGVPVPAGVVGEIAIRSPTLMTGYWNNPVATRAAFFRGWFVAHR